MMLDRTVSAIVDRDHQGYGAAVDLAPTAGGSSHGIGADPSPCHCNDGASSEISKWGGARANSGGSRPGAGRKPKPAPTPIIAAPEAPRWCVVVFWGQAEISATRELSRQGYDTYLPMTAIRRPDPVIPTRWLTVRVPHLPGYGFIRITQVQSREPILATRGVCKLLCRPDGRVAFMPDWEIAKWRLGDEERLELPKEHKPVLKVGARVRVEEGAFTSFPGTVMECDGVKTRVEVEIFGRLTPVWLDRVAVVEI